MANNSEALAAMAAMNSLQYQYTKTKVEVTDYDNKELLKYVVNTKIEKDKQKPKESLIKEIDENEDIPPMPDNWPWDYPRWKDYCKRNNITNKDDVEIKRIPSTDLKAETGYIIRDKKNGIECLYYVRTFEIKKQKEVAINELKDIANEYRKEDPRIKKEKEEKADNQQVDVEKLLSALDKIANKLLDLEYYNATVINELVSYITDDPRIVKGTHLKKDSIDKLIHDIDNLISDAEYDLDSNELMVLYFGIYLARVKNKAIRNKGIRKVVNNITNSHMPDYM